MTSWNNARVKTKLIAALGALTAATLLAASAGAAESVKVEHAWVRAPAPGQKTAGAYVELTSARATALVAAASPAAARVELHSMTTEGGVMRMRALERIELPAGRTVRLAPGGLHIMLFDLKQPLKVGEKVALVLSLQTPGASPATLAVDAEVRATPPSAAHQH